MTPPPELYGSIPRPDAVCKGCGAPLTHLPKHTSALRINHSSQDKPPVERLDFCPRCQAKARSVEYYSLWPAKRPAPPPPPRRETRRAQAASMRELFFRLADDPDPDDLARDCVYLLAHLLMKTGAFKWLRTDDNGILYFLDRATKSEIRVDPVTLDPERLAAAQEKIQAQLEQQ